MPLAVYSFSLYLTIVLSIVFQSGEDSDGENEGEEGQQKFIAHVPVPSQKEVMYSLSYFSVPFWHSISYFAM